MLHELDVMEAQRIADLALEARRVRDRLLQEVPETELGEVAPARGEHNPGGTLVLDEVLQGKPAFVALRDAIIGVPRDIREKVQVIMRVGRGEVAAADWDEAVLAASLLTDADIVASLLAEADLRECIHKGLYLLRGGTSPADAA
jgi:hypothetical protein